MSMGTRMSSKRVHAGDSTTLIATAASSPRIRQQVVFLELRTAIDGLSAFERTRTKTFVEGVTAPLSEIDMKAELSGSAIILTMHHDGSLLREVTLTRD